MKSQNIATHRTIFMRVLRELPKISIFILHANKNLFLKKRSNFFKEKMRSLWEKTKSTTLLSLTNSKLYRKISIKINKNRSTKLNLLLSSQIQLQKFEKRNSLPNWLILNKFLSHNHFQRRIWMHQRLKLWVSKKKKWNCS